MRNKYRILALVVLALAAVALELTRGLVPAEDAPEKHAASLRASVCHEAVYREKQRRGLEMSREADINKTGMIGLDYSYITTTIGNLEAKRTSTNPNMAAVVVDMLNELKLQPGDRVAVNCSGSFPALNIAVMCAIQELELEPYLITSLGASTHGANDPEFTYPDMEYFLVQQGLLEHSSDLFSIGGMEDLGKEMPPELVDSMVSRIKSYGYPLFYDEDLIHNVLARYERYCAGGDVKCFINVGGNDVSFGDSNVMIHVGGGILTHLPEKDNSTGLVQLFLKSGTPVIHLLNIKSIATEYGLPIDPVPMPAVGQGGVYYETGYDGRIAWTGLAAALLLLWLGRNEEKKRGGTA